MKIDADIKLSEHKAKEVGYEVAKVSIDADYVSAYEDEILDWVANELESMFKTPFNHSDFTIQNLEDIQSDLMEVNTQQDF